ncbi:MAG TPA: flagellar biosynthetic protein FliR [Acetobacteraceae bacterium]|nr:flagellar biosynthetic protein FliR [Acetobacteraceae bacterium]
MLISEHALLQYLGDGFWPFMRLTGVFLTAPVLGNSILPVPFRVLLSALVAGCLAGWGGPWPSFPSGAGAVIFSGAVQLAFGALMGLVGQIVVAGIAGAGELASLALGINFATASGLTTGQATPVLSNMFQWVGLLVYLALGGPFLVMEAVNRSFQTLPAGIPDALSLRALVDYGGAALRVALLLSLPALAAGFAMNAVIGLANTLASQLNIFSIGFPLLFLGGIWILAASLFAVEPLAADLLREGLALMAALAHG